MPPENPTTPPITPSKTKTSFYRRLYVAQLIDTGVNTVPAIMDHTGMPRRTAQDTITALHEIGVTCHFHGAKKSGHYQIDDWGPINPSWIVDNLEEVKQVLGFVQ